MVVRKTVGSTRPMARLARVIVLATLILATAFKYGYPYKVNFLGRFTKAQLPTVTETGLITVNASEANIAVIRSFASWGMFIDQSPVCNGSFLDPGLYTGPVFTNGGWTFGTTGAYTFTDPVGSADPNAGYQFSLCFLSPAGNYTSGAQHIIPNFQAGFQWGQAAVPLPLNDFGQKRAVLDGIGLNTTNPTLAELNTVLKNASGT